MDDDLPKRIHFLLQATSKHDCFFNVGPESGPKVRIGAIKILLMAESEVFLRMLDESPMAEKEDIPVIDSDPETFMNFLKCIYGGTDIVVRHLSYEKCMSLLYLCEKYLTLEVKENVTSMILQLYHPLSVDHAMISLSNPSCITDPSSKLTKAISKVIQNNTEKILNHKSFLNLDSIEVEFISKQDSISTKEVDLWKAVFKWAQRKAGSEDPKSTRTHLGNILKLIRFSTMGAKDFCASVVPSKVLTLEEVFEINMSIGTKTPPKLDSLCGNDLDRMKIPNLELTFTHIFHNINDLTGSKESSKEYRLGEFDWYTGITKNERNNLDVYVCCSSATNKKSWKCNAKFEFKLVNHMNKEPKLIMSLLPREFSSSNNSNWGSPNLISFEDLLKIENGYIKNNTIEITATIELLNQNVVNLEFEGLFAKLIAQDNS